MNPFQSLREDEEFIYTPGIKHNRIAAPEMSFVEPNLPALIREVEGLIKRVASAEAGANDEEEMADDAAE